MSVTEPPAESREPDQEQEDSKSTGPVSTALGFVALAAIAVLALLILYRIYPDELPSKTEPGFVDNIFANNLVVFATRLVLFSAALVLAFVTAYIIWSIINWMKLGQFLTRAGPFEVSQEAIHDLKEEIEFWRQASIDENAEAQALRQRVEDSDQLIEQMYDRLRDQDEELERLREAERGT